MSLSMMTKLQLMAYTDGELSEAEIIEVEGLLSRDVEARQFVSAISEPAIGNFVRANEAARVSPSVVDAVMARIEADTAVSANVVSDNVVSLASRKKSSTRVVFAASAVTVITAIAACAMVYVGMSRYTAGHQGNSPVASAAVGEGSDDSNGVAVDSPSNVSVFSQKPGTGVSAAVVVWFDEDDDDDEAPGGDR